MTTLSTRPSPAAEIHTRIEEARQHEAAAAAGCKGITRDQRACDDAQRQPLASA
jgi:hypothetical protein